MENKDKKDEKNTEKSNIKNKTVSLGDLDNISFDQLDKL